MRIIVQDRIGGAEVLALQDREKPTPAEGEVLVRVHYAGINPVDISVRTGRLPLLGAPPFTVGWDISGIVEALGPGVADFAVGDAVFGMPRFPKEAAAYADYVAAPAHELARKPENLGFAEAAGLPLAGLTAWQGLIAAAELAPGQKVLIHAGAGGVGHIAVQLVKAFGGTVVATASAGKLDYVRSIGADEAFDYAAEDFTDRAADFDIVLDTIAGEHAERSLKVLKPGGHLVCLRDPSPAASELAARQGKPIHRVGVRPDARALREMARLTTEGRLKVHVARSFPLEQAGAAQEFLGTHPIGKVVLAVK